MNHSHHYRILLDVTNGKFMSHVVLLDPWIPRVLAIHGGMRITALEYSRFSLRPQALKTMSVSAHLVDSRMKALRAR